MKKLITAFVATSLILGAAVASASIPDSGGVIHGCYKNSNPAKGAVVVIDSDTETCPSGTTPLNWSQTGPQGPAGATGAAGADGVSGHEIVISAPQSLTLNESNGWTASASVSCPAGKVALGGGAWANQAGFAFISGSRPGTGSWEVRYRDNPLGNSLYTNTIEVTVHVVCASV